MGIDNSDSQKWKLTNSNLGPSTGGTIIDIYPAGEINYPLQPCFFANLSGSVSNVTGDGTGYTIICDNVAFDQTSSYNNSTGVFTAPVAGKYLFSCAIAISNIGAGHTSGRFFIAASSQIIEFEQNSPAATQNSDTNLVVNGTAIISLAASATVSIKVNVNNSTKTIGVIGSGSLTSSPYCTFSGYLLA